MSKYRHESSSKQPLFKATRNHRKQQLDTIQTSPPPLKKKNFKKQNSGDLRLKGHIHATNIVTENIIKIFLRGRTPKRLL